MARVAAAATLGVALIGVWATRPSPTRTTIDVADVARCPSLEAEDEPIDVQGVVVPGSVRFTPSPCEHRFLLRSRSGDAVVPVVHPGACIEPDGLFTQRPTRAVVRGRLERDALVVDRVLVQCSYRGSHGADVGE